MRRKYTLEGFVEVRRGDVVVNVGAYVGAFSVYAAEAAARVLACEPSERTFRALERTTGDLPNVTPVRVLLYNEEREVELMLSQDPTENSVIDVDGGATTGTEPVRAATLSVLVSELGLEAVDFLKVDAEGAEPEVIEGALDTRITKLAVDCGAERPMSGSANSWNPRATRSGGAATWFSRAVPGETARSSRGATGPAGQHEPNSTRGRPSLPRYYWSSHQCVRPGPPRTRRVRHGGSATAARRSFHR